MIEYILSREQYYKLVTLHREFTVDADKQPFTEFVLSFSKAKRYEPIFTLKFKSTNDLTLFLLKI